ncbi:MAG: DUF2157 domain-containing protein [Actinomycetales bacterium]
MQSEDGNPTRGLDQRLATWVRRGLVTAEQAEAIWHFEHGNAAYPGQPTASAEPAAAPFVSPPVAVVSQRRIPVVAEVLAYLGGILATVAALLVIGPLWESLGTVGQLLLLAGVSALLVGAGLWLLRLADRSASTMGSVLWLGGLVAITGLGGKLAEVVSGIGSDGALLAAGLVATGTGFAMWWLHRHPLQLTALVMATAFTTLGFVQLTRQFDATSCGVAFVGLGAIWLTIGWTPIPSKEVGTALGAVFALVGALLLCIETGVAGQLFANLVAAALIVAGAAFGRTELLAVGAIGLLIALPVLITGVAGGTVGVPLGLLCAAAVLLVIAQRYYRRAPRA